jgi:hypothetical protein
MDLVLTRVDTMSHQLPERSSDVLASRGQILRTSGGRRSFLLNRRGDARAQEAFRQQGCHNGLPLCGRQLGWSARV